MGVPALWEAGIWRVRGENSELKELSPVSPRAPCGVSQVGERVCVPHADLVEASVPPPGGRVYQGPPPPRPPPGLPSLTVPRGRAGGRQKWAEGPGISPETGHSVGARDPWGLSLRAGDPQTHSEGPQAGGGQKDSCLSINASFPMAWRLEAGGGGVGGRGVWLNGGGTSPHKPSPSLFFPYKWGFRAQKLNVSLHTVQLRECRT